MGRGLFIRTVILELVHALFVCHIGIADKHDTLHEICFIQLAVPGADMDLHDDVAIPAQAVFHYLHVVELVQLFEYGGSVCFWKSGVDCA